MTAPDFTGQTEAELMRFCSVTSKTLTDLCHRIAASGAQTSSLETAFDQSAELLSAALAELDSRYPGSTGDDTERTTI